MSELSVNECGEESSAEWDAFVERVSGTYCHLFGWKRVFERAYRLRSRYLALSSSGTWVGVLPLAVIPRLPGGVVKAVSLPYCGYGGLLHLPGADAEVLKDEALKYLANVGVRNIEFRELAPSLENAGEVTMILSLPTSVDLLWKKVGDKVRNQIRKAERSGLKLRWGADQCDDLHVIYAKNMGRLGTPVHSPRFIKEILASLEEHVDILTVRHEDRPIGAMLVIKHGETWSDPIASCLAEFNSLNPNMLLYWEALRSACDAGAKFFDFGRSHRDSGTYRFKKQWGANEVSLNYHTYQNGSLLPSASTTFYRGKNASRLAGAWRCLPTFVQGRLGPSVRRWLP